MIERLERRGWVRRALVKPPPVESEKSHIAKSKKAVPREGRKFEIVGLTAPGKKFVGGVLRKYSRVFATIMRGIEAREQESLIRICLTLQKGGVTKFLRETTMEEVED